MLQNCVFFQVVVGVSGLKPLEVVVEFVSSYHSHFTGGIFFVNALNRHFMMAAESAIKEVSTLVPILCTYFLICFSCRNWN